MYKLILLVTSIGITLSFNCQTLISEDFEGFPSNTNIPAPPVTTTFQNNNNSASCTADDGWRIWSADATGTTCSSCSGQRGIIDYNLNTYLNNLFID